MKILEITNRFHPAIGGVETHVLNLSRELFRHGHEVTVVCSNYIALNSSEKFSTHDFTGVINGIKFRRFHALRLFKIDTTTFLPYLPIYFIKNASSFDIIHVHSYGYFVAWMPILLAKIMKKKIIYTPHYANETVHHPMIKYLYDLLFGGWSFRWSTKIIALTNTEREILVKKFRVAADKIVVIPNGINHSELLNTYLSSKSKRDVLQKYGINAENRVIINIGRIARNKGQIFLLQAFSKIEKSNLIIIGKDWGEQGNLEGYISQHNLSQVHILNNIDDNEKNLLLHISDVFVLSSIGGEAFGIVLLEAMLNGVPVVASDVGGVRDLIHEGKNGFLANPGDPEDISKKIQRALKVLNTEETKKYCTQFAKQFDWKIIAAQIEREYNKIQFL